MIIKDWKLKQQAYHHFQAYTQTFPIGIDYPVPSSLDSIAEEIVPGWLNFKGGCLAIKLHEANYSCHMHFGLDAFIQVVNLN